MFCDRFGISVFLIDFNSCHLFDSLNFINLSFKNSLLFFTQLTSPFRELYLNALIELGRVCRKWCVCLTQDARSMKVAITGAKHIWRFVHVRMINHGGIRVGIYLFQTIEHFNSGKK